MGLIDLLGKLESDSEFERGDGASDEWIAEAEGRLDVKFPDSYRKFLQNYGYVSWSAGEIFGQSVEDYFDVVVRTEEERQRKLPEDFAPVPAKSIAIAAYSGGGVYLLHGKDAQRPNIVTEHLDESGYAEERMWSDFERFIEHRVALT